MRDRIGHCITRFASDSLRTICCAYKELLDDEIAGNVDEID
jgi:hypothetical protein